MSSFLLKNVVSIRAVFISHTVVVVSTEVVVVCTKVVDVSDKVVVICVKVVLVSATVVVVSARVVVVFLEFYSFLLYNSTDVDVTYVHSCTTLLSNTLLSDFAKRVFAIH